MSVTEPTRINVGGQSMPSVNRLIRDGIITYDALAAADNLPEGSARTVLVQLRKAALQLLGLQLQRTNPGDQDAETLDRCQAVGHLSIGAVREIVHATDHVLSDRYWIERTGADQDRVAGRRSDELLQFSDRGDDGLQGVDPEVQPFDELPGGHQVFIDTARVESHHGLLALHGLLTRYVTGALLASRRWLQRMGWVRRAAVSSPRPSDTTTGGDSA